MRSILLLAAAFLIASCGRVSDVNNKTGKQSNISSITLELPKKDTVLKGPTELLTGYHLSVTATPSCAGFTNIDETRNWSTTTIDHKILQGCDYLVILELGKLDASGTKLAASYYSNTVQNKNGTSLTKQQIGKQKSYKLPISLFVTDEGKTAGFQGNTGTGTGGTTNPGTNPGGGTTPSSGETDVGIDVILSGQNDNPSTQPPNVTEEIPEIELTDGMKAKLWGTDGILSHTRIWFIGDKSNVKHIFFAVHGDGNSDYSDSTSGDRKAMTEHLASGEGAIVAYPVSVSSNWPAFNGATKQRQNNVALLMMYRQLEKAIGRSDISFQQFSLSGGGRVDHGMLRLILEKYDNDDTGLDVKEFVDSHVNGLHSGEALSYDLHGEDGLTNSWIKVLKAHSQIRASFVHGINSEFKYMLAEAITIGKAFGGGDIERGKTQNLESGRLRWWAGNDHWTTWKGQFADAFFGTDVPY